MTPGSPSDQPLIRIRGVGRYFGPAVELHTTDATAAWHTFLRILGFNPKPKPRNGIQRPIPIAGQVLEDINLDIEKGAIVCLEGASGAGKTVLLRIVAGTLQPTEGRVEITGRVSSLLKPGANLDDRQTARENVEMQRRLKGLPLSEAEPFLKEVIEFAQLKGFEDLPVRTFSTGMRMRLSLGIAMLGDPDILIVDDVLAVGDIGFQERCVSRLLELRERGTTMLLAFSDQALVRRLATRVVRLRGGGIDSDGPPGAATLPHHSGGSRNIEWEVNDLLPATDLLALTRFDVGQRRRGDDELLCLDFELEARTVPITFHPSVILLKERAPLLRSVFHSPIEATASGTYRFTVELPTSLLHVGRYALTLAVRIDHGELVYPLKASDIVKVEVTHGGEPRARRSPLSGIQLPWEVERLEISETAA